MIRNHIRLPRVASALRAALVVSNLLFATAIAADPSSGTAPAASDRAQVLVITGSDPYLPAFVDIDAAMRGAAARQRTISWLYESLDTVRFVGRPDHQLAEVLARKYDGIRIDAVVLVTEPALDFYLQQGVRLWPRVPAVYSYVAADYAGRLPADLRLTGVPVAFDFDATVRIARALQPNARRVVVVAGASPLDQMLLGLSRRALAANAARLDVEVLSGRSLDELTARLSLESNDTIVLFAGMLADEKGQSYVPRDVLAALSAASKAPIYGAFETYVGAGIAAGSIESMRERGERVGELLLQALGGGTPASSTEPPVARCVADARQLAKFGLRRAALPAGCELRYVEPTFFQRYWWQSLLVAVALVAQFLLIAALLLQRRRRRTAELGLAAQRVQLLHASRLAVAGELTASIAHEINQPLGAILSNADAAEMLVLSGRLERAELLQILADIKRDDLRASEVIKRLRALLARHEVERRRLDLHQAITDSVAILGAEARRRGASIETELEARAHEVFGDPIQIQQVLINLILNAFDASASLPAGERRVRVSSADTPEGVLIRVRDFGHGIAAGDLPHLFDSFFTTKADGMGLGLAIARSIVEAHGGTIAASSRTVGAEFQFMLPTAPSPDPELPPAQTP